MRATRAVLAAAALMGLPGLASAASLSFTGTFATDDQIQLIAFSLSSPGTIVAQTWSYAGGTNQAGTLIPAGGFDPYLSIFDSLGTLLTTNDNGTCGQVGTDPVTGLCSDSYLSVALGSGTYTLVVSQSGNSPNGPTLADGFSETGNPTYTAAFGCSNGMFCDPFPDNRTGNWAVDIDNVSSAGGVPEPGTLVLAALGVASLGMLRRRKG